MNIRNFIIIIMAILVLGLGSTMAVAQGNSGHGSSDHGTVMQDDTPDEGGGDGDVEGGGTDENGDGEEGDTGDTASGDDEEGTGDEAEGDEEAAEGEETPADETPAEQPDTMGMPGMDMLGDLAGMTEKEQNIQNALDGIRDYEVSYDTNKSRQDLTPQELRALEVTYSGDDSDVARRTAALNGLDLLDVLSDRYQKVEDEFAADPDEIFDPESGRALNYFQPRGDPFVITNLIPSELRPELEGTGLDGAVDPDLLEELYWANYQAQLRLVPIYIIGTMEAGPNKMAMYTVAGMPRSFTISEGQSRGHGFFNLYCAQVSEDFVVFVLMAGTASVTRTFHVRR